MARKFYGGSGRSLMMAAVASFALAGCQTTNMTASGTSSASTRSVSFQDTCAPLRQPFEQIRAERQRIVAQNVVAGVVVGALLGAAMGGDRRSIATGAILGGLGGAASAYVQNAQSRGATEASLRQFVDRDARNEAAQNDRLVRTTVDLNACRLNQMDAVAAQASRGEITNDQARATLQAIQAATRQDNRAIQRVAGFGDTYQAYVGVLNATDVAAARQTQTAVQNYRPTVRRVSRSPGGGAGIAVARPAAAPTAVAQAEQRRQLMSATAAESNAVLDAELQARLDSLTDFREI